MTIVHSVPPFGVYPRFTKSILILCFVPKLSKRSVLELWAAIFRLSVTLVAFPELNEPESGAIDAVNLTFSVTLFAASLRPVTVKFILWSLASAFVLAVPGGILPVVSSVSSPSSELKASPEGFFT